MSGISTLNHMTKRKKTCVLRADKQLFSSFQHANQNHSSQCYPVFFCTSHFHQNPTTRRYTSQQASFNIAVCNLTMNIDYNWTAPKCFKFSHQNQLIRFDRYFWICLHLLSTQAWSTLFFFFSLNVLLLIRFEEE